MTTIKSKTLRIDYFSYLKAFFNLMKPRVMSLVIFTCAVGLLIAPVKVNFLDAVLSLVAVALGAGAAGALNMWYESDLDSLMTRTCLRPIPTGKLTRNQALAFGILSSLISVIVLYIFSNLIAAILLATTILFYVFVYTIWLKRKTPQNIVIGGASGALPPLIGWAIATNGIALEPIILFLIIFIWTPSHFWALSLYKSEDYRKAKIPMLPITSGIRLGTQAVTTRGFGLNEFKKIGDLITKVIEGLSKNPEANTKIESEVKKAVVELCSKFPIYNHLVKN